MSEAASATPAGNLQRTLRFIGKYRMYQRGDVAGFNATLAQQLVNKGVAVFYDAAGGAPPVTAGPQTGRMVRK